MLRQPLERELAASIAAAAKARLGNVTPEVLHLGNHTTVRLASLPIVARIASGTTFDFSESSFARELAVARHLASRDTPSVRPLREAAGPYLELDCAVTLWELVEGRAVTSEEEEFAAAVSLQRLHSALADFDGELPSFITKVESCEIILANPAQAPQLAANDRVFLEELYLSFRKELGEIGADAWQPLHGDTHLGNVLITGSGAIWMDLEAACVGPLEWDVVTLPSATWSEFPTIDLALMRFLAGVRSLCVTVWCWAEFDRSPATEEAAIHHLAELRRRFR